MLWVWHFCVLVCSGGHAICKTEHRWVFNCSGCGRIGGAAAQVARFSNVRVAVRPRLLPPLNPRLSWRSRRRGVQP